MKGIPSLNLAKVSGFGQNNFATKPPPHQSSDTKRISGEKSFLLDFFEKFHDAHSTLTSITTFTREEFFKETYMIEALAVGLP